MNSNSNSNNNMTNKNSHYSYETSSSKQKQQQNHDSSRKVKIKGRRKFNNNIFLTTTGGSSCEQILFLFVLLMGLIVLFNTYHIFKIEDYGHSHSSHNIHQHQYHPLAAAAISNNNNNKDKEKEKVVVVVPQFPLQKSSKEEEDEDDDELTSQSPTEDNEATKENDSTTKDKDKEDDDDDDELTSQSPTEGDEATKENDSITKDDDSSTKEKNPDESSPPPPQIKDDKDVENEIDEHLLRILRHVGINKASDLLDSKDKNNDVDKDISYYLPTWEEVIQHVGNDGPIILGLEKCQEYNTNIVPNKNKRHIGIAGPFSSGTHYLSDLLIKNCDFPIAADTDTDTVTDKQKLQYRKDGILWQVPWGKHQSPKYRMKHNTKLNDKIREAEAAVKKNNKNKDSNEKDKLQLQQKLQGAKDELKEYNQSILPPSLLEYNTNVLPVVVVRGELNFFMLFVFSVVLFVRSFVYSFGS